MIAGLPNFANNATAITCCARDREPTGAAELKLPIPNLGFQPLNIQSVIVKFTSEFRKVSVL